MSSAHSTKDPRRSKTAGELWGGLAAMLVALPSAIAFGVATYAPLGAGYVATGALAGILGAVALGIVAPLLGRGSASDFGPLRARSCGHGRARAGLLAAGARPCGPRLCPCC